jgi:hypothetical protein
LRARNALKITANGAPIGSNITPAHRCAMFRWG